jgi:periplasmic divalent cation tolerance protein
MSESDEGQRMIAVITTVSTRDEARTLARSLVEQNLAACAQISEVESFYRWDGALQQHGEFHVLFKTTAARYAAVEAALYSAHPYEVPAIYALPVALSLSAYATWVAESVTPVEGTKAESPADV